MSKFKLFQINDLNPNVKWFWIFPPDLPAIRLRRSRWQAGADPPLAEDLIWHLDFGIWDLKGVLKFFKYDIIELV